MYKTAAEIPDTYNLKKITQFDQKLIYEFEPEIPEGNSTKTINGKVTIVDYVTFLSANGGQFQDMFDAYLYAQDEVLAIIEKNGIDSITPEQLLSWINGIHKRIAHTLARGYQVPAGEFTKQQVTRWLPGVDLAKVVKDYLNSGLVNQKDVLQVFKEKNIDSGKAQDFLKLLSRFKNDNSIDFPERGKSDSARKEHYTKSELILGRLITAYRANQLAGREKAIVDQILVICMSPEKYPEAMLNYANDLLKAWRRCDKNNPEQAAQLCYQAFFNLTEIHPYFNANGRTATCLMNIILKSLRLPSILMRNAGERSDSNSSYSRAIAAIKTNPELMIQHLYQRIIKAKQEGSFDDHELAEEARLRVRVSTLISAIRNEFPSIDLKTQIDDFKYKLVMHPKFKGPSLTEQEKAKIIFQFYIDKLSELYTASAQIQSANAEKQAIVKKLAELTGYNDWKMYNKNGPFILLALEDEAEVARLVDAFKDTKVLQAKKMRNPKTGEHVVQLDAIDVEKLLALPKGEFIGFTSPAVTQTTQFRP